MNCNHDQHIAADCTNGVKQLDRQALVCCLRSLCPLDQEYHGCEDYQTLICRNFAGLETPSELCCFGNYY